MNERGVRGVDPNGTPSLPPDDGDRFTWREEPGSNGVPDRRYHCVDCGKSFSAPCSDKGFHAAALWMEGHQHICSGARVALALVKGEIDRLDRKDRAMLRPWLIAHYGEDGAHRPTVGRE